MGSAVTACQLLYLRRRATTLGVKNITPQEALLATIFMQQRQDEIERAVVIAILRGVIDANKVAVEELKVKLQSSSAVPGVILRQIDFLINQTRRVVEKMEEMAAEVNNTKPI